MPAMETSMNDPKEKAQGHASLTPDFEPGGLKGIDGENIKFVVKDFNLHYGSHHTLHDIGLHLPEKLVTAFIGPSGCGKSTLLRCFNRMNDLIDNVRIDGRIKIAGHDIMSRDVDVIELRKRVGMVFQRSNPFPKSIYENIAYALKLQGIKSRSELDGIVETSLRNAALWDEVKDRLHGSALGLSGGQQQR